MKELKCRYAVFRMDVGKSEKLLSECENADKDIGTLRQYIMVLSGTGS